MFKRYLIFLVPLLLLAACKEEPKDVFSVIPPDEDTTGTAPVIESFYIGTDTFTISSTIIEGYIALPKDINTEALKATFTASGVVEVNGVLQESGVTENDFSKPVVYTVYSDSGKKKTEYVVKLTTFTRLPKLFITTKGAAIINSKENYVNATFRLEPNGQYNCDVFEGTGRIKGRGNTTWHMPKKSYKIKLDQASGLLEMDPYKEWTLLANYADKTLMRNYLANELATLLDMSFAPAHHFVEVFLNGKHVGNYMLSDQVEIGKTRVNITKPGGYLLEIDFRAKDETIENVGWFESYGMPVALKEPDEMTPEQFKIVKDYVTKADKALKDYAEGNKNINYRQYFDEESTIKWFLVNEFFKNCDAQGFSSIFFYKDKNDDKLYMGPVWDFDIAAGNAAHLSACQAPKGWWVRNQPRINRMYTDPEFVKKVKEMWSQYRPQFLNIINEVDVMAERLDLSQKENFKLWPDFEDPSGFVVPGNKSYEKQIIYLKDFLQKRFDWLDTQFQ